MRVRSKDRAQEYQVENITFIKKVAAAASQFEKESGYWLDKLSGNPEKTGFPCDYKNKTHTNHPGFVKFRCPDELFARLMKIRNDSDVLLFMVLTAGVVGLLNKYTGSQDIIMMFPIFKQKIEGEFVNTVLTLRNSFEDNITFKALLLAVKQDILESAKNANYPIEMLLYNLDIPVTGSENPLSDTGVLLENIHDRRYLSGIHLNIIFSFNRTGEGIDGIVEYNQYLYKRGSIEKIAAHFMQLMRDALTNIDFPLTEIEVMSNEEKKQTLQEFNDTAVDYQEHKTILHLFRDQVVLEKDRRAVVFQDKQLVYGELNQRVNRMARYLRKKGIRVDTPTAIITKPCLEMVIAMLAVLKAGGAYLPIDPDTPAVRLDYMLKDSQSCLLFTQKNLAKQFDIKGFMEEIVFIDPDQWDNERGDETEEQNPASANQPDDVIYTIYTSGTTGKPKAVLIKHWNLVNYISWFSKEVALSKKDRTVLVTSFAFDLGYTAIYSSILGGGELHIVGKEIYLSPGNLLKYVQTSGVSYIKITPSHFTAMVEDPDFGAGILGQLRLIVLGGEELVLRDVEKLHAVYPHIRVMNHYGPTETTIGSVAHWIDLKAKDKNESSVPIGKPISNSRVYILNNNGKPLPIGIPGELCISGDGVGRGYLNNPEMTAEKFCLRRPGALFEKTAPEPRKNFLLKGSDKDHRQSCNHAAMQPCSHETLQLAPYHFPHYPNTPLPHYPIYKTGDLARWLADGNIEFLGRIDQQVKIRGFRIELKEIRHHLLSHAQIKDAVVLVKKGERGNQYLCVYLVPDKELQIEIVELKRYLTDRLPDYMVPVHFVQVKKIPLTPNGKIDKKSLDILGIELRSLVEYESPRSDTERVMEKIWKEILEIEKPGIHDNFFDLGGNSLDIMKVNSKMKEVFKRDIPVIKMFEFPTIASLAGFLTRGKISETISQEEQRDHDQALNKAKNRMKKTLEQITRAGEINQ